MCGVTHSLPCSCALFFFPVELADCRSVSRRRAAISRGHRVSTPPCALRTDGVCAPIWYKQSSLLPLHTPWIKSIIDYILLREYSKHDNAW